MAVELNIIKKSGSWFSYGDTKLGQGRDYVRQMLVDNKELANEIEAKIMEIMSKSDAPSLETSADSEAEED